jgi:LPPG:FO 2-phospho-L-lactate transferase
VLLSGGTGGAKLARGLLDVCDQLTVVANTGDDVEVHGVHVSPDPDLVTYWLADDIDPRGWGLRGDTSSVMDALRDAGRPVWFHLGDRDLAMCLVRTALLREGRRLTEAHAAVVSAMGVSARVLPMSDQPVATFVRHAGRLWPFQEYMIAAGAAPPVEGVALHGLERARPTDEVLAALASCDLIVIGPSNPVISIGPILALPGMREAVAGAPAPVVAVSPFVGGRSLKGPTEHFCEWAGIETSAAGIAGAYAAVVDGLVADEAVNGVPCLVTDTLMGDEEARRRVASEVLEFGVGL